MNLNAYVRAGRELPGLVYPKRPEDVCPLEGTIHYSSPDISDLIRARSLSDRTMSCNAVRINAAPVMTESHKISNAMAAMAATTNANAQNIASTMPSGLTHAPGGGCVVWVVTTQPPPLQSQV